jgi:putative ABC transport system permease protein
VPHDAMNAWKFLSRSLAYYARSHFGTLMGACIASAVLTGALMVGDSVRGSLYQMAMVRLGKVDTAIVGNDRLFQEDLAQRMQDPTFAKVSPALQLPAVSALQGGDYRSNHSWLFGVKNTFWDMAADPDPGLHPSPGEVALGVALAQQLHAQVGATVILRVQKPSLLSPEAPLAPEEGQTVALRLKVSSIVSDAALGRFSLQASQLPPMNAFVDLEGLQQALEIGTQANLLLMARGNEREGDASDSSHALDRLQAVWSLEDSQLKWQWDPDKESKGAELRSDRVFLDDHTSSVLLETSFGGKGILTYFVNALRSDDASTPYSMVSATDEGLFPLELDRGEIAINQWLADDMGVGVGDALELDYYKVGLGRALDEATARFEVKTVVPLEAPYLDASLMPDFPGLKDAENCRDWDTGFPIDLDAIRDQDNAYWETYQGTPKAFLSLKSGQALWNNRFGRLTSVRYPQAVDTASRITLGERMAQALDPQKLGIAILPVREQAWASVAESQDFGGLFIGFSFFLILAALVLMNLLFQFVIEQRTHEAGVLKALGMTQQRLRALMLREGVVLACLGSLLGVLLATLYAKGMLWGLTTLWKDATGTSALALFIRVPTLIGGLVGSILVASLTLFWGIHRASRQRAHVLLTGMDSQSSASSSTPIQAQRRHRAGWVVMILAGILAFTAGTGSATGAAAVFFGSGMLALGGGWLMLSGWLMRLEREQVGRVKSLFLWALRNAARRRRRSLATITLLAFGAFLVMAVGANKLDASRDARLRSSGTGGFAFWAESSVPIMQNPNAPEGLENYGLYADDLPEVSFVPFRVREGEEASCLNLNRAQRPRIMGVDPDGLISRQAFSFASSWKGHSREPSGWQWLHEVLEDGSIPGIADHQSILWAMGKKVGDVLEVMDASGEVLRIRLVAGVANSILQGSVLIAESHFTQHFQGAAGYKAFLVDAPAESQKEVGEKLSRSLEDVGFSLYDSLERMNAFNAVQNTYLSTFQLLGGLGLILGSFGLGAVVLRNLQDRRKEWAILAAVGFSSRRLRGLVCLEHLALLVIGLLMGAGSAVLATWPSLGKAGEGVAWLPLCMLMLGMFLAGLFWTWAAASRLMVRQVAPLLQGP